MKTTKAAGTTAKHAGTAKHAATKKHSPAQIRAGKAWAAAGRKAQKVHAKAKTASQAKAKALALGDMFAVCTIEALAASLRCQGLSVADSDVLDLFRRAGGDEDKGMPIRAALEAAGEHGLGGFRPVFTEQPCELAAVAHAAVDYLGGERVFGDLFQDLPELAPRVGAGVGQDLVEVQPAQFDTLVNLADESLYVHGLILGVELPGQHTVFATADGWWSWGQLWDPREFPDAVIDEAWTIEWSAPWAEPHLSACQGQSQAGRGRPTLSIAGALAGAS